MKILDTFRYLLSGFWAFFMVNIALTIVADYFVFYGNTQPWAQIEHTTAFGTCFLFFFLFPTATLVTALYIFEPTEPGGRKLLGMNTKAFSICGSWVIGMAIVLLTPALPKTELTPVTLTLWMAGAAMFASAGIWMDVHLHKLETPHLENNS